MNLGAVGEVVPVPSYDLWRTIRAHLDAGRIIVLLPNGMSAAEGRTAAALRLLVGGSGDPEVLLVYPRDAEDKP